MTFLELGGIKIDGQFIRKLGEHLFDLFVIKSSIELAKEMAIETITEFVETQQIADKLKAWDRLATRTSLRSALPKKTDGC
ncbi:EAL domain-containing protein [Hydrogenovibrio halophilus]|uniref:EAL domain-containing protein n=1 Tax=Hydrogenovibrio halophilus TaxID=373391 RepID=UPI00389938D4